METATLKILIPIIAAVNKHGKPAVMDAIATLGKDTVNQEDVETLLGLIKPPENAEDTK